MIQNEIPKLNEYVLWFDSEIDRYRLIDKKNLHTDIYEGQKIYKKEQIKARIEWLREELDELGSELLAEISVRNSATKNIEFKNNCLKKIEEMIKESD